MTETLLPFKKERTLAARSRKASWLGALVGLVACLPGRSRWRIDPAQLRRHDYSTSTQRLGVCFVERIRRTFRFRWLNKA